MKRTIRRLATLAIVVTLSYLGLAPVPVEPVAWRAPAEAGYVGPHARNNRLAGLRHIALGGEHGPEHVRLGPDGRLYASVASGAILRMNPDGSDLERWATTGGRVLGFDFDAAGRLIGADAMKGLVALDARGAATLLTDRADRQPIRYANSVVVAGNGRVYFTDASARFAAGQWGGTLEASILDILEHSATGRVLEFDPATGVTRTVLRDLCFANGLALSADEQSVFVAETGAYRIWQVDLSAREASAKAPGPAARVLLDNLPGYPDNLMRGRDGRLWVGFAKPRSPVVDAMAGWPSLRKVTVRLPRSLWPVPPAYGHVVAFDERGAIVADLQDPDGTYPETTGVTEAPDRLYVQSLHATSLGWMSTPSTLPGGSR
jgi:sugar lactone lactonase YvrE